MDKENLEKNNLQQMITTVDKYKELNDLLINKIEQQQNNLIESKYFNFIMFYWKSNKLSNFQKYFDDLIVSDEGFLMLLDKMIWLSKANIGTEIVIKKKFDYKTLENYLNLDICKQRLDKIKNNDELIKNHKETVSIFYKYFDKRNDEFYM